jgi:nitrogen-specific signal transduction histidine kinase/CheY-like chemotaxis protein
MQDITERKKIEAEKVQLETLNRQLQKAESLGRMAGAIAHNFNNQLQAVIGNLEMAMIDRGSETLTEALKAAHKAADISALMLTYSGNLLSKHESIDLSAVCRQSLSLLQATAPKNVIIKGDFPASGPFIRANADQIQQVLANLITNAWESVDNNRSGIGLTVKKVSQKDIPAFKRFPPGWNPAESIFACLEVADAGCGTARNDIEKIFDPFYTTKFTGRGMGLSVVLGIVKSHNGGITVESEPGMGSIFRVFFPLSTEEILHQPDKPIQPPEFQEGGTMLLIEDEEQVRNMARTMLTHLGYRVLEAKDGIDAVEIFRQHQDEIRCVLSDLTMPRMNGWDTLAALRKISPNIPVILSSGYDEARVMADEHSERPNAFIGKPYQLKGLRETISRVLAVKEKNIPQGHN